MLAEADAKGLYATLEEADVLNWLEADTGHWGLILAGDVLCYFGELEPLLRAVRKRLAADGWFVFSVEERLTTGSAKGDGWVLHRQGRYAHTQAYLEEVLPGAGLSVRSLRPQVIRHEGGAPVPGFLVVAEPAQPVH